MANHETTNSYACSLIERLSDALAIFSSNHCATRTIQIEARAYLQAKKLSEPTSEENLDG